LAKISNELKVALTVIVSLIVAFIGFRVMQDLPIFRQSHRIYAYFERVDGLSSGNYIYINGVKVGSVKEIQLADNDSVRVAMGFDLGVSIPKGSVAVLESSGLLNEKAIVVRKGTSGEMVPYEGYIKGEYEGGMMETLAEEGEKLSRNVSSSFDKLSVMLEELNKVLTEENRGKINQTLANLENTSDEISGLVREKRDELDSSIGHINSILTTLDTLSLDNRERVDSVLAALDRSLDEFEQLSSELSATSGRLNTILQKIDTGEGTLGKLVNDSSLYNRYDSLAVELKTLIRNINENPNKYLKHMRLIEVF